MRIGDVEGVGADEARRRESDVPRQSVEAAPIKRAAQAFAPKDGVAPERLWHFLNTRRERDEIRGERRKSLTLLGVRACVRVCVCLRARECLCVCVYACAKRHTATHFLRRLLPFPIRYLRPYLIGVNVAEVKFSAILQNVKSFPEDFELVGSQVDDAIGNDDVDRVRRHAGH